MDRIYLASPHMSKEGFEKEYVKEAFDTNWIAPLGENVNKFEEDIAKYVERIIVMNHGHVAFDDTPKKVFAHYKELEKIGLAAPQMTYIMHALKEHGMDVDVTATTVEEARDTILAALGSQKKNGKKGAEVC